MKRKKEFNVNIEERLDLGSLVTFVPNKKIPIYNWFYFKEGFSRDFVHLIINLFKLDNSQWILDPFLGVGTTLLACKEKGINGIGIEVNPLFLFIANVKLAEYNIEEIRVWSRWLFSQKFERPSLKDVSPLVRKAFNKYNLQDIIFFKDKIMEINDEHIKNFMLLALMRASSKVTYAYKDGAVIKIIKKPTPPFRSFFKRIVKNMVRDLKKMKFEKAILKTYLDDARQMKYVHEEEVDAIITSPPYLNKIEYTRVYEIETELFLGKRNVNMVRSYIGLIPRKTPNDLPRFLGDVDLPPIALSYFQDMWKVTREMYRVLRKGGKGVMVVAEGIFPDRIVESDIILARLALETGFRKAKIWVVNRRVATRNRTIKIGVARESMIFIYK